MSTKMHFVLRSRMLVPILATLGWLSWVLCWMVFAWSHYGFLQNLVSLGIATLFFAAIVGALCVADLGLAPAATILATLGWLSLVLYWIGFAWGRHTLIQNGAVLMATFLVWQGMVVVLWLRGRSEEFC